MNYESAVIQACQSIAIDHGATEDDWLATMPADIFWQTIIESVCGELARVSARSTMFKLAHQNAAWRKGSQ